jgi:uncharacterized protein
MKHFFIFLSIILVVYGLVNYYIFIRGWQAIPKGTSLKTIYLTLFLVLSLSYVIGRLLENYALSFVSDFFIWVGSFWLAFMVYFLFAVILVDLLRLANSLFGIFPSFITTNYDKAKEITAAVILAITVITVFAGHINALIPDMKKLDLAISGKTGAGKIIRIAAASDIHLGTLVGNGRLSSLVKKINSFNPDLVLFPGDIVDEDLGPVIRNNMGEILKSIKSKYGVYAITGNHEFYGGVQAAVKYLTDHGIIMLRDSVVQVDGINLVGRDDLTVNQVKQRAPLSELMKSVDRSYPVILMDHQPFNLQEAVDNGVDLQLSGHTHHGQLWPFNFITKMVYELSWGYMKKGNTQFYVSSGYGGWGPPVRLGNRPEILFITLTCN